MHRVSQAGKLIWMHYPDLKILLRGMVKCHSGGGAGILLIKTVCFGRSKSFIKKELTGCRSIISIKTAPGWPTYPADPEIFSDAWWRCGNLQRMKQVRRSMGIGMSGYTIDWPKSDNLFNKIIYSDKGN